MPAVREQQSLDRPGDLGGDRGELGGGAIFVVAALNDRNLAGDPVQRVLDVPGAERGFEPDVVPAAEGVVQRIAVALACCANRSFDPPPISVRGHPARGMDLSPLHLELPDSRLCATSVLKIPRPMNKNG
jgi:hypothetical protein